MRFLTMELNNLINTIKPKSSGLPKFFAIELGLDCVKTALWEVDGGKPRLITTGTCEEYQTDNQEDLVKAVDASLSVACQDTETDPDQVVFSLPESWVETTSIAPEKKDLLKLVSKKLGFKPLGFVVTHEAIIHHLQAEQGGPLTAILVNVNSEEVTVTIMKNGKNLGTKIVGRSNDLASDVQEGLARFEFEGSLPPKIILYNGATDLEAEKQVLVSYDWQDNLPFLHPPQITTLTSDQTIQAVVFAGGKEVVTSNQNLTKPSIKTPHSSHNQLQDLSQEFGFATSHQHSDNLKTPKKNPLIQEEETEETKDQDNDPNPEQDSQIDDQDDETKNYITNKSRFRLPKLKLPNLKLKFPRLPSGRFSLLLFVLPLLLILIAAGTLAAYWYLPKATVTLIVAPKDINQEITFTIDPALDQVDLQQLAIPGRIRQEEVSDTYEAKASGQATVGEKASGTVTLFNRTTSPKTLSAGTQLTASNSLTYTITESVSIASASTIENEDFSLTTEPATADVSIQAAQIGSDYNLDSGTEFSVANFDKTSFVAKAISDISGGTSREVTVLSKKDLEDARAVLTKQISAKAAELVSSDDSFLSAISLSTSDDDYQEQVSAKVGQETKTFSVTTTLNTKFMTYKKSDLDLIIEKSVLDSIPSNHQLVSQASKLEILEKNQHIDESILVTAKATAQAAPLIDKDHIKKQITGKFPDKTRDFLLKTPGVTKAEIEITPEFIPAQIKTFPRIGKNIILNIEIKP